MPSLARLYECAESYCTTLEAGVGIEVGDGIGGGGFSLMFYLMGKALSGELYCTGTGLVISVVRLILREQGFVRQVLAFALLAYR